MTKSKTIFYGAAAVLMVAAAAGLYYFSSLSAAFRSVEFGLAELSPNGSSGGYAMPASGASQPTNPGYTCDANGRGVTLTWNAATPLSVGDDKPSLSFSDIFSLPVAYALGGGGGSNSGSNNNSGGSGAWQHNHPTNPAPVSYCIRYGIGRIPATKACDVFVNDSTSAYISGINPDTRYNWDIEAVSGGVGSGQVSTTFICPGQPDLTLRADQYQVPYGDGTNLYWDSENTDTCDELSGGWSGVRPVDGGPEATGPLTKATTYNMRCSGERGQTPIRSVTISVINGTGADLSTCDGKTVVRKGESVCLNWDTGESDPQYCVLRAGNAVVFRPTVGGETTGTFNTTIAGETTFVFDCEEGGNKSDEITIKVLPEFQET